MIENQSWTCCVDKLAVDSPIGESQGSAVQSLDVGIVAVVVVDTAVVAAVGTVAAVVVDIVVVGIAVAGSWVVGCSMELEMVEEMEYPLVEWVLFSHSILLALCLQSKKQQKNKTLISVEVKIGL